MTMIDNSFSLTFKYITMKRVMFFTLMTLMYDNYLDKVYILNLLQ